MLSWAAGLRDDWGGSTTLCTRIAFRFHGAAPLNEEYGKYSAWHFWVHWVRETLGQRCVVSRSLHFTKKKTELSFYQLAGFVLQNAAVSECIYHFYAEDWENTERLEVSKSLKPPQWESPNDSPLSCLVQKIWALIPSGRILNRYRKRYYTKALFLWQAHDNRWHFPL